MTRIRETEEKEREVYEATRNEDMDYHQIFQIIKQIQEYQDEVYDLFEEVEKHVNEVRSL